MAENYNEVTILIVDDDDLDVIGIKRAFKNTRIENPVERVRNGVEALEILRGKLAGKSIIVLLDLNMPVMGGFEFLNEIRHDAELNSIIIFVLTTSKSDEDKLAAYAKNIAGYVVKSELGTSFQKLIDLLTAYWHIIEFPDIKGKV
ncbi:response regulator [Colwellia sp. PAMC 21821]|uniref:response regulator n=1 Tax=Colwellia sp. PAMC 21821 TaxID=1816219 RepID=UPI0009BD7EB1|nr:response regulator [Colwellia sp. PAMC 21821]ARD43684.1 two-component system response regulator [Colwellia sp. PAMC 21821]